ncbi:Calmodulin, partial [Symbiodinium pilosum]
SHTWLTFGLWKILSLSLRSALSFIFCCWLLAVSLAIALCMLDVLPMPSIRVADGPGGYEAECATGPWVLLAGFMGCFLGLLFSPFACGKREMCFIDKCSIHQEDHELKERGIYGIGGFLQRSRELRVLWSSPYLSRLWCVFELAAYRKANPTGKITFVPLYIESVTCAYLFFGYILAFVFHTISALLERRPSVVEALAAFAPGIALFHALRKLSMARVKLFSDMEHFDMDDVKCSEEFDREFVLTAINDWYGSSEAFVAYVRGPLRTEMSKMVLKASTPWSYCLLITTSSVCQAMTALLSLWKCGTPADVCLSYMLAHVVAQGLVYYMLTMKLTLHLCDRFAAPWRAGLCNVMQSCLIFICWLVAFTAGDVVARIAYKAGPMPSAVLLGVTVCALWLPAWLKLP